MALAAPRVDQLANGVLGHRPRSVEADPVDHPAEPGRDLRGHLFGRADRRDGFEHRVVDQRGHLLPASGLGERSELSLQLLPPFDLEHRPVGRGRGVERDQPAPGFPGRTELCLVAAAADDDLAGDGEIGAHPAGTIEALGDGRLCALAEVRGGVEGHD